MTSRGRGFRSFHKCYTKVLCIGVLSGLELETLLLYGLMGGCA